jgi:hypothetical protein
MLRDEIVVIEFYLISNRRGDYVSKLSTDDEILSSPNQVGTDREINAAASPLSERPGGGERRFCSVHSPNSHIAAMLPTDEIDF